MRSRLRAEAVETVKDVSLSGAQTGTTIWAAPTGGERIYLSSLLFTVSADCNVKIFMGTDATGNRLVYQDYVAGSGACLQLPPLACPPNTALKVTTSAGNIGITMVGMVKA